MSNDLAVKKSQLTNAVKQMSDYLNEKIVGNTTQLNDIEKYTSRKINLETVYGLVGDWDDSSKTGTDNSAKFQQAVNEVSMAGGGTLYLPKGKYKISTPITWKNHVSLIGDGSLETTIYMVNPGAGKPAITHDIEWVQSNVYEGCNFIDFGMDGSNVNTTGTFHVWDKGIFIQKMRNCYFTRLYLKDFGATALGIDFLDKVTIDSIMVERAGRLASKDNIGASGIGIGTNGMMNENFTITNCITNNCGKYGIFVEGQINDGLGLEGNNSKGMIISNCISKNNRYGFGVLSCNYVNINNCITYGNEFHGINITGSKNVKISSCDVSSNNYNGIGIWGTEDNSNITILNTDVHDNTKNGISIDSGNTSSTTYKNIRISNCDIYNNKDVGVALKGHGKLNGISISNNYVYDNGTTGSQSTGQGNGIFVFMSGSGTVTGLSLKNNDSSMNSTNTPQKYGFRLDGSLSNAVIKDNVFIGNTTNALFGTGSMSDCVRKGNVPDTANA